MAPQPEALPNYTSQTESPEVKGDLGVEIMISGGTEFPLGEPVVLRGAYRAGMAMLRDARGIPMSHMTLIVYKRNGDPDAWLGPVQDAHNIIPKNYDPSAPDDPSYRESGYFNLNLAKASKLIKSPGRYWVMAAFKDFVSTRVAFEVYDPAERERQKQQPKKP